MGIVWGFLAPTGLCTAVPGRPGVCWRTLWIGRRKQEAGVGGGRVVVWELVVVPCHLSLCGSHFWGKACCGRVLGEPKVPGRVQLSPAPAWWAEGIGVSG